MMHIHLTGCAGSGKSVRAHALFEHYQGAGKHTVLIDDGETYNTGRTLSRCDILITTTETDGPLTVSENP